MPRSAQPPDFEARHRSDKSDKSDASRARMLPPSQTAGQPHQHTEKHTSTSSCHGWSLGHYTVYTRTHQSVFVSDAGEG